VPTPILKTVLSQETAVTTLRRALEGGRVHHAYLFTGPDGVGKELAAFGLAQALVCETARPPSSAAWSDVRRVGADACGECSACTRVVIREGQKRPVHPDVIVLERGLYEPAQIGRRSPETQDISIDQVRTLVLARAAFAAHEGRAKVFIIRRAEELSTSAANALLKTLEEPGRGTHFVLLTSMPGALLPTILSRTQHVRFGPLPDAVVAELLVRQGVAAKQAQAVARLAGGSVSVAARLADPDETERREAFVSRALAALDAKELGSALELAEEAKKDKDALPVHLAALASRLAEDARAAAGALDRRAEVAASRYALVLEASRQLDGNASAQLVVESMLARMRGA
jgi:DNA polymerase III subunit delta'